MKNATIGYLTAEDGLRLRWARWKACVPHGKATVVALSGRGEYLEKYAETVHELTLRGFDVYGLDWRGQGLSARMLENPHKGFVRSYDDYLKDLERFMAMVVRAGARPPFVLAAHSMGAHVGLRYLYTHADRFRGAVLTSPLVDIAGARLLVKLIRLYVAGAGAAGLAKTYVPGAGDSDPAARRFKGNRLTSDRNRFDAVTAQLNENPALAIGGVTHQWLKATFDSIDIVAGRGFAEQVHVPVLMVTAGKDTIVSRDAQQRLCRRLPDCRLVVIEGARHEILIEADRFRNRFWKAFDDFVSQIIKNEH